MKRVFIVLTLFAFFMPAWTAMADDSKKKVKDAIEVIEEVQSMPEKGIPSDLLRESSAIAIFPGVIKAGFIFGGKFGRGVILRHNVKTNSWSPPAFFSIGAGSVGWQIGAQSTDLVLVIRSKRGLEALLSSEFTLGADASVAAGPVGRKAAAGVDTSLEAEVLSYSRSRGLFAGLALEGAKLNSLEEFNQQYYGKHLSARDILLGGKVTPPDSAIKLIKALSSR
ncbi:MAG: lipid-binding SYLF domain-containing protein [Mariprofundaceae bacterium]